MPTYNCKGGCGKTTTTEKNEILPGGWFCPECEAKEWNAPSGHNCSKCNKSLNKMEFKSAIGRDSSVHDDPSKAVCDSCCQGDENLNHRCTKCNKPFKYGGEKYIQITNSARAGDYHPNCWAEIEKQQKEDQNKCSSCGNTTNNGSGSLCDSCYLKEQQRERERDKNVNDVAELTSMLSEKKINCSVPPVGLMIP